MSQSPILSQLESLDIFHVHRAADFPFGTLLDLRHRFEHLERIHLCRHLVPDTVLSQLSDWPAVRFLSYDRRENARWDLLLSGGSMPGIQ